jgi:hypothetical protein
MNYSQALPENNEDVETAGTYEQLSMEFQKLYPIVSKAIQLIRLMYNRLTMVDKLSHKNAISKIYRDHKHLQGFSQRNIRRSLLLVDNPNIPHRGIKKIGPSWPNPEISEPSIGIREPEKNEQSSNSRAANQDCKLGNTKSSNEKKPRDDCPNCNVLLIQTQKVEQEKNKVVEGLEQALQVIQKQEEKISEIQNTRSYHTFLDQEIALLYIPLQQAMASAFKLKENKLWLTIIMNKDTGQITAVYIGRKSQQERNSIQSILTSHG